MSHLAVESTQTSYLVTTFTSQSKDYILYKLNTPLGQTN